MMRTFTPPDDHRAAAEVPRTSGHSPHARWPAVWRRRGREIDRAPPGTRSPSSAGNWLISLVRWVITLYRRWSSNASTVTKSAATTGFASPCDAATLAAAAASITSFRVDHPGTIPEPALSPSKAHPRQPHHGPAASEPGADPSRGHFPPPTGALSSRRYPQSEASLCIVASTLLPSGALALEVCVCLYGSTPIMTIRWSLPPRTPARRPRTTRRLQAPVDDQFLCRVYLGP